MMLISLLLFHVFHSTPVYIYVQDPQCYTPDSVLNVTVPSIPPDDVVGCPGHLKCEFSQNLCANLQVVRLLTLGVYTGSLSRLSIYSAVQNIAVLSDLKNTPNRSLSFELWMFDSQCSVRGILDIFNSLNTLYTDGFFKGVVGPNCFHHGVETAISTYSYRLFRIDILSTSVDLSDRQTYPFVLRMSSTMVSIANVLTKILSFFNFLTIDSIVFDAGSTGLLETLSNQIDTSKFNWRHSIYKPSYISSNETISLSNFTRLVKEMSLLQFRIVVLEGPNVIPLNIQCGMVDAGVLFNRFFLLLTDFSASSSYLEDKTFGVYEILECIHNDAMYTSILQDGIHHFFGISPIYLHPEGHAIHSITGYNISDINNRASLTCIRRCQPRFNYAYDGIAVYSWLLEKGLQTGEISLSNLTYNNSYGMEYFYHGYNNIITPLNMLGLSGPLTWSNGDRQTSFTLTQVQNSKVINIGIFHEINSPIFLSSILWRNDTGIIQSSNFTIYDNVSIGRDFEGIKFPISDIDCSEKGLVFNRETSVFESSCIECPPGSFVDYSLGSECRDCPIGETSTNNTCHQCPPGYIFNSTSMECEICQSGTLWHNSTQCSPCPPGSFNPSAGLVRDSCYPCPLGSYQTQSESNHCVSCGPYTTTILAGSLFPEDCVCQIGYVHKCLPNDESASPLSKNDFVQFCLINATQNSNINCEPCPDGLSCLGLREEIAPSKFIHRQPIVQDKYMSLPSKPYESLLCTEPERCSLGVHVGYGCDDHFAGISCSFCEDGYYSTFGDCKKCQNSYKIGIMVLLFAIILPLIVVLIYSFSNTQESLKYTQLLFIGFALGSTLTLIQSLAVFSNLSITYSETLQSIFAFFRSFAYTFDFISLECLNSSKSFSEVALVVYSIRLLIPFVIYMYFIIIFGLSHLTITEKYVFKPIREFLARRHSEPRPTNAFGSQDEVTGPSLPYKYDGVLLREWDYDRVFNSYFLIFQSFYIFIVSLTAIPFDCMVHSNDTEIKSVREMPVVICGSTEHHIMLILGSIFMLFYGIGYMCMIIWALLKFKKSPNPRFLTKWRFLFFRFHPTQYYWGMYIGIRNILIAFTPVMTQNNPIGAYLVMFTILFFSFTGQLGHWPWRSDELNLLELLILIILLFSVSLSSVFNERTDQENLYSTIIFVLVILSFVIVGAVICWIALKLILLYKKSKIPALPLRDHIENPEYINAEE